MQRHRDLCSAASTNQAVIKRLTEMLRQGLLDGAVVDAQFDAATIVEFDPVADIATDETSRHRPHQWTKGPDQQFRRAQARERVHFAKFMPQNARHGEHAQFLTDQNMAAGSACIEGGKQVRLGDFAYINNTE